MTQQQFLITNCTEKSPWRGSSSCGQGHIQSTARTGERPTDAWSRILPTTRLDASLQQHLFNGSHPTLSESVIPTPSFNEAAILIHTYSPTRVFVIGFGGSCGTGFCTNSSCDTRPTNRNVPLATRWWHMTFERLTAVTPCSIVDIYQCFGRTCYLHLQGRKVGI